jgi:hypothetical protein
MSSLVVVTFPIELRNASALTVFTVGIPTALLAVWAQPGHRIRDSLGRTLARFVVPAAVGSSLIGLVLFVGLLFLGTEVDGKSLEDSLHMAQTALTSFLVYAGLLLVIFVEPPIAWFAVAEPITSDRRPTLLALGLAIAYIVVLQVPIARGFFQLIAPDAREGLFVLFAVIAWLLLVRTFWARRVIERFLGF